MLPLLLNVVSEEGISTDPRKIRAISAWPTPVNTSEVKSFSYRAMFLLPLVYSIFFRYCTTSLSVFRRETMTEVVDFSLKQDTPLG